MGKQKSSGWLDQFIAKVPKTFGKGVAASDATSQSKPGPTFLGNPYAKEMAKRQTSIGAYDANKKASPAMQQVFEDKAEQEANKREIRNFLEEQQSTLGKAELLSLIPTPVTEVIGGASGIVNAGISSYLAGADLADENYSGALTNFGLGALGLGAGYAGIRNTSLLNKAKGPKNFMTGKSINTFGTAGEVKPLLPHEAIGVEAIGDLKYASDRELKEAYQEALDKFQLSNYKPNVDPFLDHDLEKALALDVRMKFADRLPQFTHTDYAPSAFQRNSSSYFDNRGPYSERFFNQQGYDLSKLNPQERALMNAYQHGYDAYFNKRPYVDRIPETLKNYFGELSDKFNVAVQKNKIGKDITLNRSVGNYTIDLLDPSTNKSIGKGLREELRVGDVYKEPGFLSTSLPHFEYEAGKFKDKIIVPGGGIQSYAFPNASSYAKYMGEQEVVLPKGLIRRVEDIPEPGKIITSILNPYKNGGELQKYKPGGTVAAAESTGTTKPGATSLMTDEQKRRLARREQVKRSHDAKEAAKQVTKNQTYLSADTMPADVRERLRAERETNDRINEYVANAPLTQSLTAMSRAGNDELGKLAAQTITEANPIFSASRLVNSVKDPVNNPYGIGPNSGVVGNALGTLGLVGDVTDIGNMMYTPAVQRSVQQIGKGFKQVATEVGSNMMNIGKGMANSLLDNNQLAPPPSEIRLQGPDLIRQPWLAHLNNPNSWKAERLRDTFWHAGTNDFLTPNRMRWLENNGGYSFRDIYSRTLDPSEISPSLVEYLRGVQRDQLRQLTSREIQLLGEHGWGDALPPVASTPSIMDRLRTGVQSMFNRPNEQLLALEAARQDRIRADYKYIQSRDVKLQRGINETLAETRATQDRRDLERALEEQARVFDSQATNSFNPPRGGLDLSHFNLNSQNSLSSLRSLRNRSGLAVEQILSNDAVVNKDVISKMAPEDFASTVFKPSGEVVPYQNTYDPLPGVYGMSPSQYVNKFNENLDLLNSIIAKHNKSGVDYSVTGLSESGALEFKTPRQVERWQDNSGLVSTVEGLEELKNNPVELQKRLQAQGITLEDFERSIDSFKQDKVIVPEGTSTWITRIIPGEFRGEIQDIPNAEYYKSIPGLNMSGTTASVFSDRTARRGTGTYEAINEYLKTLDLGRVKPGFNSQSSSSRPLWENAVKKGKAFGYYSNPSTVYGSMKTLAPIVGAGAVASQVLDDEKKNGGWLDKYNDGGPVQPNYNDASVSMSDDFIGDGYSNVGRNYSPAWGGQFEDGGFLQPNSYKLPKGIRVPYADSSSELAMSIGGEGGEPAYLIPSFKYGQPLKNPMAEYMLTGEHLGGPFKTWQEADKWDLDIRHPYVEKGQPIPTPIKTWGDMAMGGSLPGAVGFMYARTGSIPSNGPYAKKTKASAKDGIVLGENEPIEMPDDYINYDSDNPAFKAASIEIGQGLLNSIPEENSPAIDINFNQKNLLAEHTFMHQPGWTGIADDETDQDKRYTNRYMLKRTVSPYTTDEDVRLNTLTPTRPQDVNFISNYANSAGYDSESEYPTKVPYEGEKHWNIDRFVIDPEFSSAYPNLENTKAYTDKTQQRRNTLTDMYKYFMLQNKGDRDVAWKQANEFMTKEIDPRISGPVYSVLHDSDSLGWLAGSITSMIPNEYRRNYTSMLDEAKLPEQERSYMANEFLKNPASPEQVKGLAMDWLVNYKKMSPKEAEAHYNKLPKNEKEYYKQHLKSKKKQDKSERTTLDLSSPGNFQNGGEMKYYQNGLDWKPKSISKDGSQLVKLDQLTNFTNYNTKQPGGWLDKYQD